MNEFQVTGKQTIDVSAQVDNFDQAKELLADLEVLNEKYEVHAMVTICPQVSFGALDIRGLRLESN